MIRTAIGGQVNHVKRCSRDHEMATLKLISTLPPQVEQCRKQIIEWIRNQHLSEIRPIFTTQLSTFVDPSRYDGNQPIKSAILSVAIVKGAKNGRLIAAIVDEQEAHADVTRQVLEALSVPVFVGSVQNQSEISKFLGSIPKKNSIQIRSLRKVTNVRERQVITLVKRSLGLLPFQRSLLNQLNSACFANLIHQFRAYVDRQRKKFNVFEEYALSRIIDVSEQPNCSHLQLFRVDILVAEAAPSSTPLLVIEFDGAHHASERQAWKDNLRDSKLFEAGLPVLRINSMNAMDGRFFECYIQSLVSRVVEIIQRQRLNVPWAKLEFYELLERKISEYRKKNQTTNISAEVSYLMAAEVGAYLSRKYRHDPMQSMIDTAEAEQDWKRLCDPAGVESLAGNKRVVVTKPFATVGEIGSDRGFYVESVVTIDDQVHEISSPKIYVSVKEPSCPLGLSAAIAEAAMVSAIEVFFEEFKSATLRE